MLRLRASAGTTSAASDPTRTSALSATSAPGMTPESADVLASTPPRGVPVPPCTAWVVATLVVGGVVVCWAAPTHAMMKLIDLPSFRGPMPPDAAPPEKV